MKYYKVELLADSLKSSFDTFSSHEEVFSVSTIKTKIAVVVKMVKFSFFVTFMDP
jgi:hypothetical protein